MPSLALRGPDSSPVELVGTGRPRAVLFTATWCESYLKDPEPKTVEARHRACEQADELSQNGSVEWMEVVTHLWTAPKSLASCQARMKLRVPLAVDTEGQAFQAFGIQSFPAVALIDADGRLFRIVTEAIEEIGATQEIVSPMLLKLDETPRGNVQSRA